MFVAMKPHATEAEFQAVVEKITALGLTLAGAILAGPAERADANTASCPGNPNALGVSRVVEIDTWIRKNFRKTHPKGFWVGPKLARTIKETGLPKLRENKHFGREIAVHGA